MLIETLNQTSFSTHNYMTPTPDGDMFLSVLELDNGKPIGLIINIGKAGTNINAWAHSCARLCSLILEKGGTVNDIIVELSSMRTEKSRMLSNGVEIKSGPEGLCYLLMRYGNDKGEATRKSYGGPDYQRPRLDRR